ncbi:MAG: hypothetical protein ABFC88_00850 [Thermoguttaceae bacterium]
MIPEAIAESVGRLMIEQKVGEGAVMGRRGKEYVSRHLGYTTLANRVLADLARPT